MPPKNRLGERRLKQQRRVGQFIRFIRFLAFVGLCVEGWKMLAKDFGNIGQRRLDARLKTAVEESRLSRA